MYKKIVKALIQKGKFTFSNDFSCGLEYLKQQQTNFPHPIGIIIGRGVKIGKNCTIYQNVTIGAKTVEESTNNFYPQIGDNVIIGANAVIIGNIIIGDNAYVGAGSVVTKSVNENDWVVGNPAKRIKNK